LAQKFKQLVLHPFFFTLFPILSLYVSNLGQVPFLEAIRPLLIGLAAAALLLVGLNMVTGNWHRAGFGATLAAVLFFSFGHVQRLFVKIFGEEHFLGRPGWLVVLWLALFALGLVFTLRHVREPRRLTYLLNLAGITTLITCLGGAGLYGIRSVQASAEVASTPIPEMTVEPVPEVVVTSAPVAIPTGPHDVYWIVLDGYGRSDILSELYGLDNYPFIDFLESEGFYVADQAHSNYGQTALSLASTLNMDYLDQLIALNPDWNDRAPVTEKINNSIVADAFTKAGYKTIAFSTGYNVSQMTGADNFIEREGELNKFEITLLSGSLGDGGAVTEMLIDDYRQRVEWQVSELDRLVGEDGPKFVFAHFILPHPPFLFTGEDQNLTSLAGGDGSAYSGTREEYVRGYAAQLKYTNLLAAHMIANILANSKKQPVIIVSGDHGPGSRLDWTSGENSCMRERFSILNAIYFPGRDYSELYPSISPVNTFRVVLNQYQGTELELLPDRSYFSPWERPYDLLEVTGRLKDRCE
jgi:hypothetical protein